MLDFKRVLASAVAPERGELQALSTPWGEALDPERVLPEHPRPTLVRDDYTMLNGIWEYAITPLAGAVPHSPAEAVRALEAAAPPAAFDGSILVPFSPEAPASGVGRALQADELLWYRRHFTAPALAERERLILHFEAVDWACAIYVNGRLAATHTGAYLPFDVDATPFLHGGGEAAGSDGVADGTGAADGGPAAAPAGDPPAAGATVELLLCALDPSDAGEQLRGKQSAEPSGIWYTAQSGIWQSVWYEVVPASRITRLVLVGDAEGNLQVEIGHTAARGGAVRIVVADAHGMARARTRIALPASAEAVGGTAAGTGTGVEAATDAQAGSPPAEAVLRTALALPRPHRWQPDDPYLYTVRLELESGGTVDRVASYCAFRTVCVAPDEHGTPRFMLNGEPLFLRGVLDQGYWPEGLLTAPADEALVHDIQTARDLGFNLLRKHIKVESARWYYHADRLGMLVWQDMPSGGGAYSPWWTSRIPTLFSASWGMVGDGTPGARRRLSGDGAPYRAEWLATCEATVQRLSSHPCVAVWSLFNEGWGQFDAAAAAERVHGLDPSRPVNAVCGWYDQRAGDFLSVHNYFRPLEVPRETGRLQGYAAAGGGRAHMISEFGGLVQAVEGHTACAASYGYGNFATLEEWRDAVRAALTGAAELEDQGLAGFVYTQLADVESELNGLMTYDRRVNKLE